MVVGMSGGGWWQRVWVVATGWVFLFGRREIQKEKGRDEIENKKIIKK